MPEITPRWYQKAIIYELHVRAFADSDNDGNGDFRGLVKKLDYLQDLGVTAIWLLPFYPSPLKDDGYDIADYTNVHPSYGNLNDFKLLLREAHRRNIRVITELVINHTSDQHPWFQRARHAKPGSKWRDFYMWSDNSNRYKDARIIFKDFETSNWTWDPIAKAYYWHRFYSHQPDLNYDNPEVHKAILEVADFWLEMGVDGVRLDAVPYLYAREGTNCENLPETHQFLKKLRKHIDDKFTDRMLLAEANQWPEDAISYFGNGDECNMAFHFPLMPRMFMALRMEDRFPIIDIMQQTPPIPEQCQWSMFLRNHDELTLEMVTDEERDYMYRVYARDPQARINLGIRRRLAPLLSNNRKKIELMNGLLFSLPGTPVIYYGDEIGMGDNFYLGDRNGVRTPMQWSADRNAGFSKAHPHRLYMPIIVDSEYHYESINVATAQENPESLLWWMKRLLALRKRYKALALGSLHFLHPDNSKVLAFITEYADEKILVIANLSRFAEYVELDLSAWQGMSLLELFGQSTFPSITIHPYFFTLGPHSFYWFLMESPTALNDTTVKYEQKIPILDIKNDWSTFLAKQEKWKLENILKNYLVQQRWFGHKTQQVKDIKITEIMPMHNGRFYLLFVTLTDAKDEQENYYLPITTVNEKQGLELLNNFPLAIVAELPQQQGYVIDACYSDEFNQYMLKLIGRSGKVKGEHGLLWAERSMQFRNLKNQASDEAELLSNDQSNTCVLYGKKIILKYFRHLVVGENPEIEMGQFLTREGFEHSPKFAGNILYKNQQGELISLGLLQEYIPNEIDAWQHALNYINRFFDKILSSQSDNKLEHITLPGPEYFFHHVPNVPAEVQTLMMDYAPMANLLGQRIGELHLALTGSVSDKVFLPEAFSTYYQRSLYQSIRGSMQRMKTQLKKNLSRFSQEEHDVCEQLITLDIETIIAKLLDRKLTGKRIRCHGDLHLGQILFTGKDFFIIDFEGEPARHLSERRIKRSPLRDVAGMLRSFHYATQMALYGENSLIRKEDIAKVSPYADFWYHWASVYFLQGYLGRVGDQDFLPKSAEDFALLLKILMLQKGIYEIYYELNNRPKWIGIPARGLLDLIVTHG